MIVKLRLARLYGPEALSLDTKAPKLVFDAVGEHPQVPTGLVDVHAMAAVRTINFVRLIRVVQKVATATGQRVYQPRVLGVAVN